MSKAEPNVYVNNVFDDGKTDDDVVYEKCFDTEDQSNYDQLSPVSKESPPKTVFTIAHNIPADQSIQKDNCRSQKIQVPWRLLFFISSFLITIVVSNVVTFITTKDTCSENKKQYRICSSFPCLNGGVCVNDDEQYYCSCTRGFSGKNCKVSPCTELNCLNGGSCQVLNGTFNCVCNSGFSGRFCEVSPCTGRNCLNGGFCEVSNGTFHCVCNSKFAGRMCEEPVCVSNPCFNSGSCIVSGNDYSCICPNGTYGSRCQDVVYEIITSPGYPLKYDNFLNISWHIDVGYRNTVKIKFSDFNLEDSYDYVKIYDGPSTYYNRLASYTGHSLPPELTSTGRYMTIVFTSDNLVRYRGFRAVIYTLTSA